MVKPQCTDEWSLPSRKGMDLSMCIKYVVKLQPDWLKTTNGGLNPFQTCLTPSALLPLIFSYISYFK